MRFIIDFIQKRARLVAAIGLVLTIVAASYGTGVFSHLSGDNGLVDKASESHKVAEIVKEEFGGAESDTVVLFSSTNGRTVTDPAFRQEAEEALRLLREQGAQVVSFYGTNEAVFLSHNEKQTYALASFGSMPDDEKYAFLKRFEQERMTDTVAVTVGGAAVAQHEITEQVEDDLVRAELISLPILGILLLLIFRSAVAAALPLVLGLFAIVGGLSVVRILTDFTDVDQYAVNVITVLGLGLSIDYALLMVSRFREELNDDTSVAAAVRRTVLSAGRTILFSGLVVMVSLLGLAIFPISFLHSVGVGGISAVIVAVFGALVLLPALLMLVGRHINRWHISKKAVKDHMKGQHERWRAIGAAVMRRPFISTLLVLVITVIVALPALDVKFKAADTDYRELPTTSSSYVVGKALDENFAKQDASLDVIYQRDGGIENPQGVSDVYGLTEILQSIDGVTRVQSLTATDALSRETYMELYTQDIIPADLRRVADRLTSGEITHLTVYYQESGGQEASSQIVRDIRAISPNGGELLVGGEAAAQLDVFTVVKEYSVYALLLVVVVMFVLLSVLLRSVVIPLQAIFVNSLSLIAALGVLVWVFQMGNFTDVSWLVATGGIDVTVPVLIFAVAFGLSMDYTVFLYGRIREEYDEKPDNSRAVLRGLELTGPIITQAAVLLAVVVLAFGSSNIAMLQQIGIGLAFVVLFDTFVVRIFLVPAIMQLGGNGNWWAPKWLKKWRIKHN